MPMPRTAAALALAAALLPIPAAAQMAPNQRWILGEVPGRGLPSTQAVWAPYDADPDHPTNRLFRAMFVVHAMPEEVAGALPSERVPGQPFYVPEWYYKKRRGQPEDARWFGGDALQLPREGFLEAEKQRFLADLVETTNDHAEALKQTPRLAIWLQNDLLRMARRLRDINEDLDLVAPMLALAERLALPRSVLANQTLATFDLSQLPETEPALSVPRLVELDRRSTSLFDASRTLLWSRVFVQWPAGTRPDLDDYLARALDNPNPNEAPVVPMQTRAVLVQGIVALADDGTAVATPVVVDVRLQHLASKEPLSPENPTTTRDGTQFRMFWLERQVARERGKDVRLVHFRELHGDDEVLFRDYGSLKHTTVSGQCSLCHRRTNNPEPALAGFSVLRTGSKPRRITDPTTRLRLAEQQVSQFLREAREPRQQPESRPTAPRPK